MYFGTFYYYLKCKLKKNIINLAQQPDNSFDNFKNIFWNDLNKKITSHPKKKILLHLN